MYEVLKDLYIYDKTTFRHCMRVGKLAKKFVLYLNKNYNFDLDSKIIEKAGYLHDIGKLNIDLSILSSPKPLSAEERVIIEKHPLEGIKILEEKNIKINDYIYYCILGHHKGYLYNGYPKECNFIPLRYKKYVSIITICDVFDALTNKRSYKNSFSENQSLYIMDRMTLFDNELYEIFKFFLEEKGCDLNE